MQDTTLGAAVQEYLDIRKRAGKADNTMRVDCNLLPRVVKHLGNPNFAELTSRHMEHFFYGPGGLMDTHTTRIKGQAIRQPVGPGTHNHYRSRISVFLDFCRSRGYTQHDRYLENVKPLPEPKRQRQQPAPSILLQLLDLASCSMHRAYLAAAANTACRASELKALKVGDVDFINSEVSVTVMKTREEDDMPLTADLERELRMWLAEYAQLLGRPLRKEDHLFPARSGNRIARNYLDPATGKRVLERTPFVWHPDRPVERTEKIVQDVLAKMGLPTRYEGTHTVRRAVARAYFDRLAAELGYDAALRTVSALLHHSSMSTTERYLGLSSEKKRRDETMKGKPFLTAMVPQAPDNVVPFRRRAR